MLKRAIDILAASVFLAVALPVLLFAGVLIRLDSPGPAIFCQARMGRRFRPFRLYKLRTMRIAADGPAYTLGADPRITATGRWLRRFKIDELPQLWNVLRGDMSLVGPRPVIPELALEFDCAYRELLTVRPGLTDPASVKYCRESEILSRLDDPDAYFKTVAIPEKIRISRDYLERAGIWSDAVIVLQTFLALASLPFSRSRNPEPAPDGRRLIQYPLAVHRGIAQKRPLHSPAALQFDGPAALRPEIDLEFGDPQR